MKSEQAQLTTRQAHNYQWGMAIPTSSSRTAEPRPGQVPHSFNKKIPIQAQQPRDGLFPNNVDKIDNW